MCMAPPNPIKAYRKGGLGAALTPPGMPTFQQIRSNPLQAAKDAANPSLIIQRARAYS